jgi:outer membrane protein assembly factor BamA
VGPGSYNAVDSAGILPDQSGDIKLEMNAELRTKLFSIVHGAVFADAGNVWLYRNDPNQPGGQFSNRFLSELAVGAGLGLRFDISFLVLRLDFAVPLRKPWLPAGERWVIKQFDPGNATWRKDNIIFNLAIGYPF